MLKLSIPSQAKVKQSLGIGPYFGYKVSDGYEWNQSLPSEFDEAMDLIYDSLKSYDIGLVVSGEMNIEMEQGGKIIFDLRVTYGLQSIFDTIELDGVPVASLDLKNMGFQILVGYGF